MAHVSFGFRFRTNVEAMNMVESMGNYTRHRTAPIIKRVIEDGGVTYEVQFLPVVSGQSLANAYSRALVDIAVRRGLPVCEMCRRYNEMNGFPKNPNIRDNDSVDRRVAECVVEDVTGFMATQSSEKSGGKSGRKSSEKSSENSGEGSDSGRVLRRTSRIQFSFLVPDADSVNHVPPVPQFHVRYGEEKEQESAKQVIYNIESASAIYTLVMNIDVDGIGRGVKNTTDNRLARVKASLDALMLMLNGGYIGARKSRYYPQLEVLGAVAVVSDPYPFVVSPPKARIVNGSLQPWYLEDTLRRAVTFKSVFEDDSLTMYYLDNEFNWSPGGVGGAIKVVRVEDINTLIISVKEALKAR
jgi:CRISPR-associated autoregulator DevR family